MQDYRVINTKVLNGVECLLLRHKKDKDKFAIFYDDELLFYNREKALEMWAKIIPDGAD